MSSGVVLLNPASGYSRGVNDPEKLSQAAADCGSRLRVSAYAGQLVELARQEALDGAPLIVAGGGDDTVREVLLGMDQAGVFNRPVEQRPHFGIVPLGTFNNFARYLGLPLDPVTSIKNAHSGTTRLVDLGRAGGQLFTESVGVGIDVAAWQAFPSESPSVFRRLWDGARAVLKAMVKFRPRRYFLEVDGQLYSLKAYSITVANCSYFSASFVIAPHAVADDGLLDLCVIPALSKLAFLGAIPLIFMGKHTAHLKGVRYQQARRVSIWSERPSEVRVDGGVSGRLPIQIEVLGKALPMRLPSS